MTKKQKKMVFRLAASAVFFAAAVVLEKSSALAWIPFILSYLLAGYDIPLKACRNIAKGQVFDENFLIKPLLPLEPLWRGLWRKRWL